MECIVRGIPVYYEEMGTGRPVLMLHGWPGSHHLMTYNLEPLFAGRPGWRRLYPDLPGMGKTPGADWIASQDDILAVVLEFLDAVAPSERQRADRPSSASGDRSAGAVGAVVGAMIDALTSPIASVSA